MKGKRARVGWMSGISPGNENLDNGSRRDG
jgi:hypothetical protein